jgi:hypothetical protein
MLRAPRRPTPKLPVVATSFLKRSWTSSLTSPA